MIDTILKNLNPPQTRRETMREIEGTPSYTERNPSINANGFWILNFEDDRTYGKWTPLDLVIVDNQSSSDLELQINQNDDQAVTVTSNNSKTVARDGIRSLKFVERSGNPVSSDDIEVTFTRQGTDSKRELINKKKTILNLR